MRKQLISSLEQASLDQTCLNQAGNKKTVLLQSEWISLVLALIFSILLAGCASPTAASPQPTLTPTSEGIPWPTRSWHTATPESQGITPAGLAKTLDDISHQHIDLHSLLIVRNGYLISETYFDGYTAEEQHELYSVTKSFISTLFGIVLDKGMITGVKQPVLSFFPDLVTNPDARKQKMTLENLLTMTTGLDWKEGDPIYQAMYQSDDWVKLVMDTPMATDPGTVFNYCSGCSHVLSAVIQQKTGQQTAEFARQQLFTPLGIRNFKWESDVQNISIGGWGLYLTPRDMAKLGYLYLNKGKWANQQVVSSQWIQTATEVHIPATGGFKYGYQWWIYPKFGAYAALGRYGQTIFVIPDLNLVIVTTAHLADNDPIFKLIDDDVVPAVTP